MLINSEPAGVLLGTCGVDAKECEGLFLQGRGPGGEDDLGLRVERRVGDVIGERAEVLHQGAKAVDGDAIVGEPGGVLGLCVGRSWGLCHGGGLGGVCGIDEENAAC